LGLGLVVYDIITKEHGGTIQVDQEGEYAEFIIRLF
jgi:C4-dicarboxylate-specific signal transduction histidine kinase